MCPPCEETGSLGPTGIPLMAAEAAPGVTGRRDLGFWELPAPHSARVCARLLVFPGWASMPGGLDAHALPWFRSLRAPSLHWADSVLGWVTCLCF